MIETGFPLSRFVPLGSMGRSMPSLAGWSKGIEDFDS